MNVLVLNSGSSSIKYRLFDMDDRRELASGLVERIGEAEAMLVHRTPGADGKSREERIEGPFDDHAAAFSEIDARLSALGRAFEDVGAMGHRVVHGGEAFVSPTRVDGRVLQALHALSPLAPLHNPANLLGIEAAMGQRPDVAQVAVFDTAFHHAIPARAHRYALPDAFRREHGIRRYGFHGTSHAYVSRVAAGFFEGTSGSVGLVTLHLGNGASAAAVLDGVCIDTSMGLTPLEGLVMGTRSGDLDPGIIFHLARRCGLSLEAIERALNRESGLRGLCGSSDMRDVLRRERGGDQDAKLALDIYTYRVCKYVGAYAAALGRLDGIVFTAGVGENSPELRARVCDGLGVFGVELSPERNQEDSRGARAVHAAGSAVQVLVVPTNEELEIAEQALRCVASGKVGDAQQAH